MSASCNKVRHKPLSNIYNIVTGKINTPETFVPGVIVMIFRYCVRIILGVPLRALLGVPLKARL